MHTPTPLSFEQLANGKVLIEYQTSDGIEVIAELVETDLPGRQYADDIVRAVNSHDALVAALTNCVARLEAYYGYQYPAVLDGNAALALAKKGA